MTSTEIAILPDTGELEIMTRIAKGLSSSSIVPMAYRSKWDKDGTLINDGTSNIIAAMLMGRAFGWDVMTSMRNLTIIQGTASIKAEAMLALIRQRGHSISGTTSNTSATVKGKRIDTGDEMSFTYGIEDAKRAGLASKDVWKAYPASMCWARAVSQLGRMLFGDVLLGLSYTPEEVEDFDKPIRVQATVDNGTNADSESIAADIIAKTEAAFSRPPTTAPKPAPLRVILGEQAKALGFSGTKAREVMTDVTGKAAFADLAETDMMILSDYLERLINSGAEHNPDDFTKDGNDTDTTDTDVQDAEIVEPTE